MRPTSVLAFAPANPRDLPAIGVSPFPMPIQFPIRSNDESINRSYRERGFAVVHKMFSAQELEEVKAEVQHYLARDISGAKAGDFIFENNAEKSLRCAFRMHEHSDYFNSLMRKPSLITLVQRLFGDADAIADGTMLINKVPLAAYEFPYHQDNAYQFWTPPDAVGVTLALDESSAESGAIVCLEGSHTQGILPHQPSGVLGASRSLVSMPKAAEYAEVTLSLQPGDVSLHHVNVIHHTGPNRTANHRRLLGFSYHSSRSLCDEVARSQYERDLKIFLHKSQSGSKSLSLSDS